MNVDVGDGLNVHGYSYRAAGDTTSRGEDARFEGTTTEMAMAHSSRGRDDS